MALNSSSQINSSSIDPSFPIAGASQSSQGFRDNFYNIQAALSTASKEITLLNGSVNNLSGASVTFTGDATSSQAIALTGQVSIALSLSGVNTQPEIYDSSVDDIKMTVGKDGRVTVSSITSISGSEQTLVPTYTTVKNSAGTSIASISIPTFNVSSTGRVDTSTIDMIDIESFGLFGYSVKSNSVIYSNSSGTTDYLHATNPYNVLMTDVNSNVIWGQLSLSELSGVSVSGATAGQSLMYNGTNWVAETISGNGGTLTGINGISSNSSGTTTNISLNYSGLTSGSPTVNDMFAVYDPSSGDYSSATISQLATLIGSSSSTSLEDDSSPTLAANLNLNGHNIISNSNVSIQTTNGTISIGSIIFPSSLPSSTSVLVCDTSGNITWGSSTSSGSGTITVGPGLALTSSSSADEISLAVERLQIWDGGSGTSTMNPGDMILTYTNPLSTAVQTTNPGSGNSGYCYITPANIMNYMKSYFIYNNTLSSDLILNGHNISSGYSISISNTSPAVSGSATNIAIAAGNNINNSGATINSNATTQINMIAPTVLIQGSSSSTQGSITVTDAVQIIGDKVTISSSGAMNIAANNLSSVVGTSVENFTSSMAQQYGGTTFLSYSSTGLNAGISSTATSIVGSTISLTGTTTDITSNTIGITTPSMSVTSMATGSTTGTNLLVNPNSVVIQSDSINYSDSEETVMITASSGNIIYKAGTSTSTLGSGNISFTVQQTSSDSGSIAINGDQCIISSTSSSSSTVIVSPNSITLNSDSIKFGSAVWPSGTTPVSSYLTTDSNGNLVWEAISSNSSTAISQLQSDVTTNTTNIATNTSNITTNTNDIATNKSNIATNTSNIASITSRTAASETNISNLTTKVNDYQTSISSLQTKTGKLSTDGTSYAGDISSATVTMTGESTANDYSGTLIVVLKDIFDDLNEDITKITPLVSDITVTNSTTGQTTFAGLLSKISSDSGKITSDGSGNLTAVSYIGNGDTLTVTNPATAATSTLKTALSDFIISGANTIDDSKSFALNFSSTGSSSTSSISGTSTSISINSTSTTIQSPLNVYGAVTLSDNVTFEGNTINFQGNTILGGTTTTLNGTTVLFSNTTTIIDSITTTFKGTTEFNTSVTIDSGAIKTDGSGNMTVNSITTSTTGSLSSNGAASSGSNAYIGFTLPSNGFFMVKVTAIGISSTSGNMVQQTYDNIPIYQTSSSANIGSSVTSASNSFGSVSKFSVALPTFSSSTYTVLCSATDTASPPSTWTWTARVEWIKISS